MAMRLRLLLLAASLPTLTLVVATLPRPASGQPIFTTAPGWAHGQSGQAFGGRGPENAPLFPGGPRPSEVRSPVVEQQRPQHAAPLPAVTGQPPVRQILMPPQPPVPVQANPGPVPGSPPRATAQRHFAPAPVQPPAATASVVPPAAMPQPAVAPALAQPMAGQQNSVPSSIARRNAGPARAAVTMRHLTNNIQGFRLSGEVAASEWPIYVTDFQARSRLRFQVSYLSAVSVMPEASFLTLLVNDQAVGRTNIVGARGVRTGVFDIPAGLLRPGFNSVRLVAEQRHRVDCSLQATYELWTQIDPSLTGLLLPENDPGVTDLSELGALPPDGEGALPIRAVLPERTSSQSIERIVKAVQMISILGRFQQPSVDIGAMASGVHGLNLAIGTAAEIAAMLPGVQTGQIAGPRIMILPPVEGRRTTVLVTGRSDDEVQAALERLAVSEDPRGSAEGLRAASAFPGYRLDGAQRVRLRDLGLISQEFSGRLFKAAFNVVMPPDFYSADYAKAVLDLAGGYAAGLTNTAQIVVSVNGRNAVSQKLRKASGDVFKENPIPLPLGAMRPGLNRIEIEAQVPTASDQACDPLTSVAGRNRFLFLDTTEIVLPRIARIARMPDLAVTTTGGFPFNNPRGKPPVIHVPAPSGETLAAAMTLAAHLAVAAGKTIQFRMTVSAPEPGSGPVIVVSPMSAIDPDMLKTVGVNPETLRKAWGPLVDMKASTEGEEKLSAYQQLSRHRLVLQRNFPAACHITGHGGPLGHLAQFTFRNFDPIHVGSLGGSEITVNRDLFREWNKDIRGSGDYFGGLVNVARDTGLWVQGRASDLGLWFGKHLDRGRTPPAITARSPLIMAQGLTGSTGDDVRMVVTAPNASLLAKSMACLIDPRMWRQISGRMAILNPSEAMVMEIPAENPTLIATQPLSLENSRLIVAGWFSLNSKVYVALALGMAVLLAFTTLLFLGSVGRKQEC